MTNSAFDMRGKAFPGIKEEDSYSKSFQTKSSREVTYFYDCKDRKENVKFRAPLKTTYDSKESDPTKRYQLDDPDGIYLVGGHQKLMEAISKAASELQPGQTTTIDVPNDDSQDKTHKHFIDRDKVLHEKDRESMEHMGNCTSVTVGPVKSAKDSKETMVPLSYNFDRDFRVHTARHFKHGTLYNFFAYHREQENQYAAFRTPLELSCYPLETDDSQKKYRFKNPELIPFNCSTKVAKAVTENLFKNQFRGITETIPFPACVSATSDVNQTILERKHSEWPKRLCEAFTAMGPCREIEVQPIDWDMPSLQPKDKSEIRGKVYTTFIFHREEPSQIDPPGFWREPTQQSE